MMSKLFSKVLSWLWFIIITIIGTPIMFILSILCGIGEFFINDYFKEVIINDFIDLCKSDK